VPLTAGGNLTIVASSDLGALGSKEGAPVTYNWVLPTFAPLLLPWLAILGLLALKPNRCAAAWWIWLPLACLVAITLAPVEILPRGAGFSLDAIGALAAGLGAIWLLSNYLLRQHRFLTFLCVLSALAGFSVLAFVSQQGWSFTTETLQGGILLAVGVLISAAALGLCGVICRCRYRPLGLYGWLLLLLVLLWLVVAAPFFVIALMSSGGRIEWSEFFVFALSVAMIHFMTLAPFLILSSASPFFRERLKALLNVKPQAPPLMAPLPGGILKT
jgi:multisubunit Na+/H+ antiporter MnhE subunit